MSRVPRFLIILVATVFLGSSVAPADAQRTGSGQMNSGELSVIRVAARNHGLRDLKLKSRTGPSGRLVVEGFTASLGTGRISGEGQVDFAQASATHRMRVRVENVEGMAFLKLLEIRLDGVISSRVTGEFDLQWRGTTGPQARRTLSGTASWTATPGYAADAEVMRKAVALTGIADLQRFNFSSAGSRGVFRDGVLTVESLKVTGPDQEVAGSGVLDVSSRQVRMRLDMKISPELIERSTHPELRALAALARGARNVAEKESGRKQRLIALPMPLTMTGELSDPQFHFGDWTQSPAEGTTPPPSFRGKGE